MTTVFERILAGIQHILPQHTLSRVVYAVMRSENTVLKNMLIRSINKMAGINVDEALSPDPADYACFNAWFTRELKPGARDFDPDPGVLLCPCDGRISETGSLSGGRILQAKGKDYSLQELLANDAVCAHLDGGYFSTIYLSPRDYHRVHMPLRGHLQRMIHVPGRLFSVAPYTVRQVPGLFARNERVVSVFATESGPMVVVLVGAMLVSSMQTVWAGEVTPSTNKEISVVNYQGEDIALERGSEMGRFNMGSTVIVLLPKSVMEPMPGLAAGDAVKVGQRLATLLPSQ